MKVFFDFETRSGVDLKKVGAHAYAMHPTTEILCMTWAFDDGPISIYRPLDGDPLPHSVFKAVESGAEFIAHNAQFDRLIWFYVLHKRNVWPALPIQQLYCTMTMAYALGLQGSLDNAAACVGLKVKKDAHGHRVMMQLAKPRSVCKETGAITWWEREDSTPKLNIHKKYEDTYTYAMQDIVVLRELFKRLLPLSDMERKTWLLDQVINDRGVYIDQPAARSAIEMANLEATRLNQEMQRKTKQAVSSCNAHAALLKWVQGCGVEADSMDKATVLDLLADEKLPKKVRKVLEIRQSSAKSSVNKINRMLESACADGRVKGCFQYHGAASTGRWAGRRIQPQNFPRPKLKQPDIEAVLNMLGKV